MSKQLTQPNYLLRSARKRKGWSIEEASEKVGVSSKTYLRWEWGERKPHPHNLASLSQAFDLPLEDLGLDFDATFPSRQIKESHEDFEVHIQQSVLLPAETFSEINTTEQLYTLNEGMKTEFGQESRSLDKVKQEDQIAHAFSRRQILMLMAGLPLSLHSLTSKVAMSFSAEENFSFYETTISLYWRLHYQGEQSEVEELLPVYLSQLALLAQQPSLYQKTAAKLASQAYQLASAIAWQQEDFGSAVLFGKQAFQYGKFADDPNLQVASLLKQSNPFLYRGYYSQAMQMYQLALHYISDISPLLQGRVYSTLAALYANLGQKQESLRCISLAYEKYPEVAEKDPCFPYARFGRYNLLFHQALTYQALGQAKEAWESLEQSDNLLPKTLERRRVELLVNQGAVSIALGELEQSCSYIEKAATSARAINSPLRYHQAYVIHRNMQTKWPHEQKVKTLAEIFSEF